MGPGPTGAEGQHLPPGSSLGLWQRSAEGVREAEPAREANPALDRSPGSRLHRQSGAFPTKLHQPNMLKLWLGQN